jgi:hypothetical protein
MSKYNKTCILCGKKYKFCGDCREEMFQPTWKNTYCSENCRTIFNTVVGYAQNTITIEKAQEILGGCDLSAKDTFREDFLKYIDEIMSIDDGFQADSPENEEVKVEERQVEEVITEEPKHEFNKKKKKR